MNPKLYFQPLTILLKKHANAGDALFMKKYMKDISIFYGIKQGPRRQLFRQFLKEQPLPPIKELENLISWLFEQEQREYHYCAIELAVKYKKVWHEDHIRLFELMILTKPWWDTVDAINNELVGPYFRLFPLQVAPITSRWVASDTIWLQRSALLFQLKYKEKTDTDLLFTYAKKLATSNEFFVQKAIGWILREYAKTNPSLVQSFVNQTDLKPLSKREALKHFK